MMQTVQKKKLKILQKGNAKKEPVWIATAHCGHEDKYVGEKAWSVPE